MALHRGRRPQRSARHRQLGEPMLKLQQGCRVELGKSAEALLVHPAHEESQGEEVVQDRARSQRQARAQRSAPDQRDQLLAGLSQRRVARVGEAAPLLQREVPGQTDRQFLLERVRRREAPDRILPARVLQEPSAIVGCRFDGGTRNLESRCLHGRAGRASTQLRQWRQE